MAKRARKTSAKQTGGLYGSNLVQFIIGDAERLHIDPAAALAVAEHEGGFSGAVGDYGTSFGPFQLHAGGKLPAGLTSREAQAWANSPTGVNYALAGIANVAAGESGDKAITDIVSKFEHPKDPAAEISAAENSYPSAAFNVQLKKENIGSFRGLGGSLQQLGNFSSFGIIPANQFGSPSVSNLAGTVGAGLGALGGTGFKLFFGISLQRGLEMFAGGVLIVLGIVMVGKGAAASSPAQQTVAASNTVRRAPGIRRTPIGRAAPRRSAGGSRARAASGASPELVAARVATERERGKAVRARRRRDLEASRETRTAREQRDRRMLFEGATAAQGAPRAASGPATRPRKAKAKGRRAK